MQRMNYAELSARRAYPLLRWGLPIGILLTLAGYFGAWVWHPAAGLVILGIDLAEYVKFLAEVRTGSIGMWREWFILPAGALSICLTLVAVNRRFAIRWYIALPLLLASAYAALSALPPAWTPALLTTPEFIKQTILIAVCLGAIVISPLLRPLPPLFVGWVTCTLQLGGAAGVLRQFLIVKPAIDRVYGTPPPLGWGPFAYAAGVVFILLVTIISAVRSRHTPRF